MGGFVMLRNDTDIPNIKPVKHYETPTLPTVDAVRSNPVPLKKVPKRWQKNAAVIACVGIIGFTTMVGCATKNPLLPAYVQIEYDDLIFRLNHGGANHPSYIVQYTEQEALGIIRSQLEAAGLRFNVNVPEYIVDIQSFMFSRSIDLDLFDARNRVAIVLLNASHPMTQRGDLREQINNGFAQQTRNLTVGVFFIPGANPHFDLGIGTDWRFAFREQEAVEPTEDEIETSRKLARPLLEANLTDQVNAFIARLRAEGILK
jgi:hypothetical protein